MKHRIFWTDQKIASRLPLIAPLIHRRRAPITPFRYRVLDGPLAPAPVGPDVDTSDWQEIPFDSYWGGWSTDFVMRTDFTVPTDFSGPIALHLPLGVAGDIFCHPEGLAYIDGESFASADRQHHEIYLGDKWCDGRAHSLALHGWTGLSGWPPDRHSKLKLHMKECAVAEIDVPTRDFYNLTRLALDVAQHMDEGNTARNKILRALDRAFTTLDTRDPMRSDAFYDSVPAALETLHAEMQDYAGRMEVDMIAVGHAHIDVAYLWQVAQTRRKTGRTFSNVLRLMDEHREYHFSQSQPVLYEMAEEDYPEVFEGIKTRVEDGHWEAMGGMWVEPDCNLAGGEALVRQIMLGRGYFRDKFGDKETPVLWLPDTFGFTASLPQLMVQSGLKWFVANKLNWNQYNQMPNQLFWWEGIDGSRVLSHLLTTPSTVQYLPHPTTYKAELTAKEVFGTWDNFLQKHVHNELITCFGYGDGGGGPTRELIAAAESYEHLPGTPRLRMGTVREFFERIEAEVAHDLPTWSGEFYLELHRGTLTSQAETKRLNRLSERWLHDAEFLAAFAQTETGHAYPKAALEQAWKLVCLNQFHDILPGTSITEVFEDAERDYATVGGLCEETEGDAIGALAKTLVPETAFVAINTTSFSMDRIAEIPEALGHGLIDLRSNRPVMTQATEGGTLVDIPAFPSYALLALGKGEELGVSTALRVTEYADGAILENDLIRVEVGRDGQIASLFDKTAVREVLKPGHKGNQLQAFEDRPMVWDAWDIDIFYEDRSEVISNPVRFEIIERGPIRAGILVEHDWRGSRITQRIYLRHNSKRIDFQTELDWHASHILLKCAFPVEIRSPSATYDIQFGNTERSTHRNTSWDWARFESVGHKWADLSEGNYGVALLNDCKYGYDIHHNVIRLSLLKSATMPDPVQDQGQHGFTYSLLPHEGDWRTDVAENGYDLNNPLLARPVADATGEAAMRQLVAISAFNVIVETVKAAEDGCGLIVRLYENERNRGQVQVRFGLDVAGVRRCNILEEDGDAVEVQSNTVTLDIAPYEIVTLRVVPR
ncbi:MAG: glycoside hydrolase family 38 C-terminal domain-containing protein [Pseudomonadota bacterium]